MRYPILIPPPTSPAKICLSVVQGIPVPAPARGSQNRWAQPRGAAPQDLGWGRHSPGGVGDPGPTAATPRHCGLGFAPPSKGQQGTANLPRDPSYPWHEADCPPTCAVAPHPTAPRWGMSPPSTPGAGGSPPRHPERMPERAPLGAISCSPLQPSNTALLLPPPRQHPGTAAHPITHWASLALGTHLPVRGAWAQHVLLGAGGLVIGAVIAMSNDTLSWLPLACPQKAGSVHLSLRGGGGHSPIAAAQLPPPLHHRETEAQGFGSMPALPES